MEHLTNCHGEWNALIALASSIPFAGVWLRSQIQKVRKTKLEDNG